MGPTAASDPLSLQHEVYARSRRGDDASHAGKHLVVAVEPERVAVAEQNGSASHQQPSDTSFMIPGLSTEVLLRKVLRYKNGFPMLSL